MSLEKEIQDSITKNLPQQIGEALQKRMKELEEKEKQLEALEINHRKLLDKTKELEQDLFIRKTQEKLLEEINQKDKEVSDKENKLEIDILKIKLEEAILRSNVCKELVQTVFRNPTFKTVEQSWGTQHVEDFVHANGGLSKYTRKEPFNTTTESNVVQSD